MLTSPQAVTVPELLDFPEKLMPLLEKFNDYKIFVIEGGRGSAKSQSIGRLLMYIAEQRLVRIFCGRELQSSIEESVYTLLADLIMQSSLAFRVNKNGIRSLLTSSTFKFKGFREQGSVNIKGIEGADIAWIDEAQAITQPTLDVLIPTLRKTNCKFIFTMNRLFRDDPVFELTKRADCLHIHIDYHENHHCPDTLKEEAKLMKETNERDYNHVWLGQPAVSGDGYIFEFDKVYAAQDKEPFGELFYRQRVMGVDFAAQGSDGNVATLLERASSTHWRIADRRKWHEPDTTLSVGRIIALLGEWKPDCTTIDVGGGGWNVYCDLLNANCKNIFAFNGASTDGIGPMSYNKRADGYWLMRDWFGAGFLCIPNQYEDTLKQIVKMKQKHRTDGKRQVEEKVKMKADIGQSPDEADSLMMAIYAAARHLGTSATSQAESSSVIRKSGSRRR